VNIELLPQMSAVSASEWDALTGPQGNRPLDPFTTHRFLLALEQSQSTGARTGWQARPLVVRDGVITAAMPLYLKDHSQGEYIFDHGWAQAFERAGGQYYPKLQSAVPFTPATGNRFLGPENLRKPLLDAAIDIAEQNNISSLHITFCTQDEAAFLSGHRGILHRVTQQFHWENRGYSSFDDFLADLSSRKRKMIRKERETARASGLHIRALTGDQIEPAHWDAFWIFYQDTGARKWGTPYLTRAFFDEIHRTMRDDILLVLAFDGDIPIAGALNFIGRETLFGRYWGCTQEHPCLHFELCYYQAIDWAIAQGLQSVEAGAQGEHKLARGYLPTMVHSLHYISNPSFRDAVAQYLIEERRAVDHEIDVLTDYGPFRRITSED
jgi:predicted N-acyltransferase